MKTNKEKITPETAAGKFLFFAPQNEEEAVQLFVRLNKAGFHARTGESTPVNPGNAVSKKIGVLNGEYFCDPNENYNRAPLGNWRCQAEQIDENYIPPDQRFILGLFNKLSERLDAIEARLDAIQGEMKPPPLDKTRLVPGGGGRKQ